MKIVTVLSFPRSGSTLLQAHLQRLGATTLLEIFHPKEAVARAHLLGEVARFPRLQTVVDQYSSENCRQNPVWLVDQLRVAVEGSPIVTWKIFPWHLSDSCLACLIAASDAILVHSRNRLHAHLSNQIAQVNQAWGGVNTSASLTEFEPASFLAFVSGIQKFFADGIAASVDAQKPIFFCSYEQISASGDASRQQLIVGKILSHVCGERLQVSCPPSDLPERQDYRHMASEKVSNSALLLNWLESKGISALNDFSRDILYSAYGKLTSPASAM